MKEKEEQGEELSKVKCPYEKPYTVLVADDNGNIIEIHREADLMDADTKSEIVKMEFVKKRELVWIMVCPRSMEGQFLDE